MKYKLSGMKFKMDTCNIASKSTHETWDSVTNVETPVIEYEIGEGEFEFNLSELDGVFKFIAKIFALILNFKHNFNLV